MHPPLVMVQLNVYTPAINPVTLVLNAVTSEKLGVPPAEVTTDHAPVPIDGLLAFNTGFTPKHTV